MPDVAGGRARVRTVRRCAAWYLLMWVVAGALAVAVGLIADSTWAATYDTGGLGAMLSTFFVGAALGNIVWMIVAFEVLAAHGRSARSLLAVAGVPVIVVAVWIVAGPTLGVVCAAATPGPVAWWATARQRGASVSAASSP